MKTKLALAALAVAITLIACGGGGGAGGVDAPVAVIPTPPPVAAKARPLQAPPQDPWGGVSAVSASDQLMSAGEAGYTQYFPSHQPTNVYVQYRYRHYPETGCYLGVDQSVNVAAVYVMGCSFGNSPVYVGQLTQFITPTQLTTTGTPWTRYVGAHYTQTPRSGLARPWAGGGLRDPGSSGTNYKPELVNGAYVDNGYAPFQSLAIPEIDTLLSQGKNAVVTVGGLAASSASMFLDGISTQAGHDAYKKAITDRIDSIAALSTAAGWENKIYFQFGNEISNVSVNGFYGNVCLWVTRSDAVPRATCDLATQFVPTYVEYYLAPGIAILQEKSQAMFGRPETIQAMLGSIVNLSNRASFLDTLLAHSVVGTYAPSLAGKKVSDLVDAVSIHYTVTTPTWRTTLDNFRNQYFPGGVPATRVRALWTTEEVGVNVAENGYGMATVLRGIARYLSWWQANAMSPDQAHVFLWGSEINQPSGGTCTGCTSVDQDMPVFYNFVGDNSLAEITTNKSTLAVTGDFESYEFSVEGQNKLVIIGFIPSGSTSATTLTGATLNLSAWNGKTVSVTAYRFANQGPQLLAVTPASVLASSSVPISIGSLTPGPQDAVVFLVQAQ